LRIAWGPGYRVYFARKSEALVILLAGGDKRTQARDVLTARHLARELGPGLAMRRTRTTRWDAAAHLASEADRAAYLEAALEDGDPTVISAALGDMARAAGMTELSRRTGLGRESLYKALSPHGNPELATVLRVLEALGLKLHAAPTGR
jgi:probable addiction module antidote protein